MLGEYSFFCLLGDGEPSAFLGEYSSLYVVVPSNLSGLGTHSLLFLGEKVGCSVFNLSGLYLFLYSVSPSNLNLEGLY